MNNTWWLKKTKNIMHENGYAWYMMDHKSYDTASDMVLHYILPCPIFHITYWGQNKMAAIFQTTFSNGFSWMKMFESLLKFHRHLFLKVQLIRKLVEKMAWCRTGHYLKQWWPRLLTCICVTQSEWVNIFTILITISVLKPDCSGWTRSIPLQLRVDSLCCQNFNRHVSDYQG